MAPVFKLFLVLLSTSCAFACGSPSANDDNSSGGTGAGAPGGGNTSGGNTSGGNTSGGNTSAGNTSAETSEGGTGAGAPGGSSAQSGGMGGSESSGGSQPVGGGGSDGGSAAASGGSPKPDQKPDPVEVYPCYGESGVYEVNNAGETAALPTESTRFFYDKVGHTLKLLTDANADGAFETGRYYEYDSAGKLMVFDYDNDGDTMIDSRAVYVYEASGKALSIDYFSPVDSLASYYTIEYDEQNRLTQFKQFRASDDFELRAEMYTWSSAWEYDYTLSRAGEPNEVSHVVLNKYGDVASKETWADESKTTWVSKTTISYDDLGRPLTEEVETNAVVRVTESSYGESGLVFEQEIREDDKLVEIVKYVYFDQCMQ